MKEHPRFTHIAYLDLIIYHTTIDFSSLQHAASFFTKHNLYQIAPPADVDAYWGQTSMGMLPWHHLEPTPFRTISHGQYGVGALVAVALVPAIANTSRFGAVSTIASAVAAATNAPTLQLPPHCLALHNA